MWLDYPLPLIFGRLFRRTLRRVFTREELWGGNRESFRRSFLSRESIFVWLFKSHRRRRLDYERLLSGSNYRHLAVVRLRSPREAAAWLDRQVRVC